MDKIQQIARMLAENGITTYYVGGCVRDEIMGLPIDDIDLCLVGVHSRDHKGVEAILADVCGKVTPEVGKKFPVWIVEIDGMKVEVGLARKETLVGGKRTDFEVVTKGVTIEEDLRRRDFTMNAIAKNVLTNQIHDPYCGRDAIKIGVINVVDVDTFKEDSLRVYRAARFLAYFPTMTPSHHLHTICSNMTPDDISNERVGMELKKVMENSKQSSRFFDYLKAIEWLPYHFKEVYDCIGVPQDPKHHPEGDVYTHTMLALDEAKDWFTRTVMLCHDLGKATTTTIDGINWLYFKAGDSYPLTDIHSYGHEDETHLTRNMLTRISFDNKKVIRQVERLVQLHMIRAHLSEKTTRKTLRSLMERGLMYEQLVEVCRCDLSARPPFTKFTPDIGQHRAKQLLEEDAMTPIVTGKKLMEKGYLPDKTMGELIKVALKWQDRGTLNEENWLKMVKQYKPDCYDKRRVQKEAGEA